MARYRIKRFSNNQYQRMFGVVGGISNGIGGAVNAVGDIAKGTAGGVLEGTGKTVSTAGSAAKAVGTGLGALGFLAGPAIGLGTTALGAAAGNIVGGVTEGIGNSIKKAGSNLSNSV